MSEGKHVQLPHGSPPHAIDPDHVHAGNVPEAGTVQFPAYVIGRIPELVFPPQVMRKYIPRMSPAALISSRTTSDFASS